MHWTFGVFALSGLHVLLASASPAAVAVPAPLITPSPSENRPSRTKRHDRRDFFDDVTGGINSALSVLGSAIPSFVASGVPNFFQDFPTGDDVLNLIDLDDSVLASLPTQVLNLPPYANWTSRGWNVRFHGNVYKQPDLDRDTLNHLSNVFLVDVDIEDLPPSQQSQARNLTASIFVVQQDDELVRLTVEPKAGGSGSGGQQTITLPDRTTDQGDFDAFVPIDDVRGSGIADGDKASEVQELAVYADGSALGNATAYLVPDTGLTIVSDIDDILRVTKIYDPAEGLLNSFARPFRAWRDMPAVYDTWRARNAGAHFHYLTTTPEQVTRTYMEFIYATYPPGSFDTRPLNFSDVDATLSIRRFLLVRLLETFPTRKFVLVADTSNSDVMKDYPEMATLFPDRVQCILLRNTSATDPSDRFPYDTSGFESLNAQSYMFFRTPADLMGLDLAAGQCVNHTFAQNVTFDWQGLPFDAAGRFDTRRAAGLAWVVAGLVGAWLLLWT